MIERAAKAGKLRIKCHPHMLRHGCGFKLANDGHDTDRCKVISATKASSTPSDTRSSRLNDSKTFGGTSDPAGNGGLAANLQSPVRPRGAEFLLTSRPRHPPPRQFPKGAAHKRESEVCAATSGARAHLRGAGCSSFASVDKTAAGASAEPGTSAMTSTSNYSRHVGYTSDGGRVVTTRSNGNASFWSTFQDQCERKVTTAANGQHTVEKTRVYREGDGPGSWSVRTHNVVSHGPDGCRQSRERTREPYIVCIQAILSFLLLTLFSHLYVAS
jgi:hypothetical protein